MRTSQFLALLTALVGLLHPPATRASVSLPGNDGHWASPAPPFQLQHAAVRLAPSDLLIVISPASGTTPAQMWALPLAEGDAWIRLESSVPRFGPGLVAVHDPIGRRILVHGGRGSVEGTWEVRPDEDFAWRPIVAGGQGPGARWDHTAVYDARRRRILVFGGRDESGALLSDTWELRLSDHAAPRWSRLPTRGPGPGARAGHAALFDPDRAVMTVFGGGDATEESDVWQLALHGNGTGHWHEIDFAEGPGATRTQHTIARDPSSGDLLLHGGVDENGAAFNDTWRLASDGSGWDPVVAGGLVPPAHAEHVAVLDPVRSRWIVSGGILPASGLNETWALTVGVASRWDRLAPIPSPGSWEGWIRGAFDTARGRLAIVQSNRTWFLDFAPQPRWSRVFDAPTRDNDLVYDAARDRLVLHGGFLALPSGGRSNETWEMALGEGSPPGWRPVTTVNAPPARMNHVVALDPERDRLLVFGGTAVGGTCAISVDTYRLPLSVGPFAPWSGVSASPFPEGGSNAVGAFDTANDRFLVHGGTFGCRFPNHPSGSAYDGTWALDVAGVPAWRRLTPPGLGPGGAGDAVYDPVRRRLLVATAGVGVSELPLDPGSETWRILAPRGIRPEFPNPIAFDYDPGRDRFVLVSSQGQVRYLLPAREAGPLPVPASVAAESRDAGGVAAAVGADELALEVLTNPVRGGVLALQFGLGTGSPARFEVIDVRGRVVTRELVLPGVRRHETSLAARPPGVYFARLTRDGREIVRKIVLTR